MEFTLQPATAEDQQFLADLFADVHAPEFAALGLPAAALAQLLAMQFNAQRSGYAAQFPRADDRIVRAGETRIGRLLTNESDRQMRIVDIALLASHRGQGIGETLLRGLCARARTTGMPLMLSVRFGNPAQHLYERMGFVSIGGNGIDIEMEFRDAGSRQAVSPDAAGEGESPGDPDEVVAQAYTARYFRTLTGRTFNARNQNGVSVQLVLTGVKPLKVPQRMPVDPGDSFWLSFRGPSEPMLGSEVAVLSIEGAQEMSMLLVPVAAGRDGVSYEAVFNRMRAL